MVKSYLMKIIKIKKSKIEEIINLALDFLKKGKIIVYPTDTCYGLGALALNQEAIKKIYLIKGREFQKPLSIIVENLKAIQKFAYLESWQKKILQEKLPGPYTFVLKKKKILPDILTGGEGTIGIRIPDFFLTQLLSKKIKIPFTTTSANLSGKPPCYSIKEFLNQIKKNQIKPDLILDFGRLPLNKPSRVIDLTKKVIKILR